MILAVPVIALQDQYFDKSQEYIPERWLKDTSNTECPVAKTSHPFAYLPFGFGSRMCIGKRFAELEIEILINRILQQFKLGWHHDDLKFKCTLVNIPDGPLNFRMETRCRKPVLE